MTTYKQARASLYEETQREAVRILREMMDSASVRPMPDGQTLLIVSLDDKGLDRFAAWGADIEDLEPDADCEEDHRDLPRVGEFVAEAIAMSSLLPLSDPRPVPPAIAEITSLQPLPRDLLDLAGRLAEPLAA